MTTTDDAAPSAADLGGLDPKAYARRYAVLATMCLSLVLIVATVSSVNVAIPSLAASKLDPSDTQILWIVDAYALVFAAFLLPAGALGDRFGRKGALLLGLVVFAAMSALSAVMDHANALIACRAVMGLGAALIMPATLSLLQSAFPPAERAKAIAVWAGFAGAGAAIGPLLGGFLLEHFWYGSVFFVAVPLALIAFTASAFLAPRSKEGETASLDPVGSLLSIVGFAALLAAIIEGPELGWSEPFVVVAFAVAAAGLIGFVMYERRASEPMLDMTYFRIPRFGAGSLGITFTFMAMFAMFFVLTQYLQYVQGYTPLEAGVRTLPGAVMMVIVSPRAPKLAAAIGVHRAVAGGMTVMGLALILLSLAGRSTPYWYVALCLMISSTGVAVSMPSLSAGIVQSVPMHKAGVGSAVNDTTREVGGAVGIAVIGSVVSSIYRSRIAPTLELLPADAAQAARKNVGIALQVADRAEANVGPQIAERFRTDVKQAFVEGGQVGLRVGAALVIGAALVVGRRMRPRGVDA